MSLDHTVSGGDDPELLDLIADALEQQDAGAEPDLEALCAERPDLLAAVREALGASRRIGDLRGGETATDDLVGTTLADRYLLLARLGAGAMGIAYRGLDRELQRPVAVKVLRGASSRPDEAAQRFAREARALATLNDPGIVTIHDRGETADGRPFLVMELVPGAPLDDRLERQSPVREAVELCRDVARSLATAHAAGVYHRDVKPSNVMVRRDGPPVLIDFGIAALSDHSTLASGDRGPGTPAYMAPEQLRPGTPPAPAADVYGLTATLYHLLTGQPPYEGSPSQIAARIPHHAPPLAVGRRPDLPRDLQAILDKGLARDPRQRYPSADALAADLDAFLEFRPTTARYVGPLRRRIGAIFRAPAFRGALAMALLALGTWAVLAWREADRQRRVALWLDNWRYEEPMLGLGSSGRAVEDPGRREDLERRLDRATTLGVWPVASRGRRALFAFDQGEWQRAADEFERLAADEDTPVTRELARRYRAHANDDGAGALSVDGLPEPQSPGDTWLVAIHLYRDGSAAAAANWREALEAADHPPSQLLAFALRFRAANATRGAERIDEGRRLQEALLGFETRLGTRTASTAHFVGQALLLQQRYAEARDVIAAGLALAPTSFTLLNNATLCARRLGDLAGALATSERAIALRPDALNPYRTRIATLLELHRHGDPTAIEDVEDLLRRAPFDPGERARYEAHILFNRALERIGADDLAAARAEIQRAMPIWRETGTADPFDAAVAQGIRDGAPPFAEQMAILATDPAHWGRLLMVHDWMPADLSAEETAALRTWLQRLAHHLAPDVEAIRGDDSPPKAK